MRLSCPSSINGYISIAYQGGVWYVAVSTHTIRRFWGFCAASHKCKGDV